jgi:hypothetical protein
MTDDSRDRSSAPARGLTLNVHPELRVRVEDKIVRVLPGQARMVYGPSDTFNPFRMGLYVVQEERGKLLARETEEDIELEHLLPALAGEHQEDRDLLALLAPARAAGKCGGYRYFRPTRFRAPGVWPLRCCAAGSKPYLEGFNASLVRMAQTVWGSPFEEGPVPKPAWVTPDPDGPIQLYDLGGRTTRRFISVAVPFMAEPLEVLLGRSGADDSGGVDYAAHRQLLVYQAAFRKMSARMGIEELYIALPGAVDESMCLAGSPEERARSRSFKVRLAHDRDQWGWFGGESFQEFQAALRNDWRAPGYQYTPRSLAETLDAPTTGRDSIESLASRGDFEAQLLAEL